VKGGTAGVGAAGFFLAGGLGAKAQTAATGFPRQRLADSPLVVDVSKIPGALLNEQIPRWVDPISFPQWLPPMATGAVPPAYGSPVGDVFHGVAPEWSNHPADWDRFPVQYYGLSHRPGRARFLPSTMNLATDFWGYAGRRADGTMMPTALPPTFRFRFGQPALVRAFELVPAKKGLGSLPPVLDTYHCWHETSRFVFGEPNAYGIAGMCAQITAWVGVGAAPQAVVVAIDVTDGLGDRARTFLAPPIANERAWAECLAREWRRALAYADALFMAQVDAERVETLMAARQIGTPAAA
jgi:hypothetical protein